MTNLSHLQMVLIALPLFLTSGSSLAEDCSKFRTSCAGGSLQEFASQCERLEKEIADAKGEQESKNSACDKSAKGIQQRTSGNQDHSPADNKRIMNEGRKLGKSCEGKLKSVEKKFSEAKRKAMEELKPIADKAEGKLTAKERASDCGTLVNKAKSKADSLAEEAAQNEATAGGEAQKYGDMAKTAKDPEKKSGDNQKAMGGGKDSKADSGSSSAPKSEEKGKEEKGGGAGSGAPEMPKPQEEPPEDPNAAEEEKRKAAEAREKALKEQAERLKREEEEAKERMSKLCPSQNQSTTPAGTAPPPRNPLCEIHENASKK